MPMCSTLGADVRPVPVVPFDDPMNYNHQVRLAITPVLCIMCIADNKVKKMK